MTDNLWNWVIKGALVLIAIGALSGWWYLHITKPAAEVARLTPLLKSAQAANHDLALENSALSEQVRTSNITVLALQKNCQMKSDRKRLAVSKVTKLVPSNKAHGPAALTQFYKELRANE